MRRTLLLFLLFAFFPGHAMATEMPSIPTRINKVTSSTHVVVDGSFTEKTGQHLTDWLERFPRDVVLLVDLDSLGGESVAGRRVSERMVERGNVRTRLTATARCESICAMLWLAGSMEAEPGARLAFHGSSIETVRPLVPITDKEMLRYLFRTCKPVPPAAVRLIGQIDQWQADFARQRAPPIGQLLDLTGAFSLHRASRVVMIRGTDGWKAYRAVAWRMDREGWIPVEPPDQRDGEWALPDEKTAIQTGRDAPAEHGVDCQPGS